MIELFIKEYLIIEAARDLKANSEVYAQHVKEDEKAVYSLHII